MTRILVVASLVASVMATQSLAQTTQTAQTHTMDHTADHTADHTMDHTADHSMQMPNGITLSEPGQGAFAALSEVVSALRNAPETDWSRVDIAALRDHLVDMDMLVTHAVVDASSVDGGVAIRIDLAGQGGGAASRMVPAHAPVLAMETGWNSHVTKADDHLIWTVTSTENARQIRALGFFGLMAVGDHHRDHHLKMAVGIDAH